MSIESVNEVVFKRKQRGRLARYWAIMGYIFQIVRDIDPKLRVAIDTFTLIGLLYASKLALQFVGSAFQGKIHFILY